MITNRRKKTMELADISQTDMTALNAQGYTEQDLSMLAKSEVAALLAVPSDDSASGISSSDPHGDAAAAQDAANSAYVAAANGAVRKELNKIIAADAPRRRAEKLARSPWQQAKAAAKA